MHLVRSFLTLLLHFLVFIAIGLGELLIETKLHHIIFEVFYFHFFHGLRKLEIYFLHFFTQSLQLILLGHSRLFRYEIIVSSADCCQVGLVHSIFVVDDAATLLQGLLESLFVQGLLHESCKYLLLKLCTLRLRLPLNIKPY